MAEIRGKKPGDPDWITRLRNINGWDDQVFCSASAWEAKKPSLVVAALRSSYKSSAPDNMVIIPSFQPSDYSVLGLPSISRAYLVGVWLASIFYGKCPVGSSSCTSDRSFAGAKYVTF
jgi:hypothetical protein